MRGLVVLIAVGSAVAAPVPKELKKADDKARILGTWVLAKANVNGKDDPNYFWHSMTFDAEGNTRFQYRQGNEQIHQYTADTAAVPPTLSFRQGANSTGGPRPFAFRDGRLVVAVGNGGEEPTSLEPGPGVIVLEYVRFDAK